MKGNGTKLFFILAFIAVAGYYLQYSVRYWLEMRHVATLEGEAKETYLRDNNEKLTSLKENIINLGLDLQGGMHVTLELDAVSLVRNLATEGVDSSLTNSLAYAQSQAVTSDIDVIDILVDHYQAKDPNARLSRYFRNEADNISRRSSNDEIRQWLKNQRDNAVGRAIEIIRTRVDRFGVNEPTIVRQGASRIVVELAGITDEDRVRNLLKGTARLEFRLAADPDELRNSLQRVVEAFDVNVEKQEGDSTVTTRENKLMEIFIPQGQSIVFGAAAGPDTAKVNALLSDEKIRKMLPRDVQLMWTAKVAFTGDNAVPYYSLIGVKERVELTGEVIEEARPAFDQYSNTPEVSMSMNKEGARKWARITGSNIGKPIAIVLDNYVYTYPNVQVKISDGRSSITNLTTLKEAEDLVNILLSGALPAPLNIAEERTVGPSLGQQSIQSGFYSTMLGLFIVAVFMIFYYQKSGAIADLALILNIVFIFGVLAAFKATLTLPGIAGIVLTIGMAVDANVLIFDRIREEMFHGKSLLAAIDAGYSNAMSAIFDSNITTFLTGAILYSFGVGPIKGFAVTLMAGIVCSLFSAIVITRFVIDSITKDKTAKLSIG
ncbi:protein translocase subunit SecD [bacterium]|nr:MAG: protein translocase subunit SecD [bacterium]